MTSASAAFLVDTNVLVYAYDPRDHVKQECAILVLDNLIRSQSAAISVQCVTEFFSVTTRRLPEKMTAEEALVRVERLLRSCRVLDLTPVVVLEGCRGSAQHRLSLWDALIWPSAKMNQLPFVLTEDAAHGRYLEGVRFLNPFLEVFDLSMVNNGT